MTKEIVLVDRERTIVGTAQTLAITLRNLHERGVLQSAPIKAATQPSASGLMAVVVVVREPAPTPSRRERLALWTREHEVAAAIIKAGAFGLAASSAVLGLMLAAVAIVTSVLTNFTHAVKPMGGALLLGALCLFLILSAKRGHPCPGLHCPTCKGH